MWSKMGSVKKSQHLADAVEARRKALDMTPGDLAERSGLSAQALRNVRNGVVREYQERLTIPLTRALGWSPDSIDRLLAGDDPIEVDQPGPAPTDDITEVLELARSMREGLTKSQSRDKKLDEIIGLCEDISHHIAELTVTAVEARASAARNEAVIAALAEHFALVVDLSQA